MDKIYVLLEIASSGQLRKTNHDVLDLVLEHLDGLCTRYGGSLVRHSRDLFFYLFSGAAEDAAPFLEALMEFYAITLERAGELQGVSLLADRLSAKDEDDSFEICRDALYRSGGGDGLIFGPGLAAEVSACSFDGEGLPGGGFFKAAVTAADTAPPKQAGSRDFLLNRETLVHRILESIVPDIDAEKDYRIIHIYGPAGSGKLYNLGKAVGRLAKDVPDALWAVVPPSLYDDRPEDPFIHGMDPRLLKAVPDYLTSMEQRVWREKLKVVLEEQGDRGTTEFLLMYQLYLTAYSRIMDGLALPPLFICESVEGLSSASIQLLARLCIEFLARSSIIPVIISESRDLDSRLATLPRVKLRVPPIQPSEIERKLQGREADGAALYGGDVHRLVMDLEISARGGRAGEGDCRDEIAQALARLLPLPAVKVLLAGLSAAGIPGVDASHLAAEIGLTAGQEEKGREECKNAGLMDEVYGFHFSAAEMLEFLAARLGEAEPNFPARFADILAAHIENNPRRIGTCILQFIARSAGFPRAVKAVAAVIDCLTDCGMVVRAVSLIESLGVILEKRCRPADRYLFSLSFASLKLRLGVLRHDMEECRNSILDVDEIDELREKTWAARYRIEFSRYLYILREFRKGLDSAKRALFLLEEGGEAKLGGWANAEVGLSMMSLGKIGEAAEYFSLTAELNGGRPLTVTAGRGLVLGAVTDFLLGSLDAALESLAAAEKVFAGSGKRTLELFCVFFTGRVHFRLGMYQAAAGCFGKAMALSDLYGLDEAQKTIYAWMARCEIYLYRTDGALRILYGLERDFETGLFLAEAYYMAGDASEGYRVLEELAERADREDYRLPPGEVIDWKNGYSSLEDRALSSPERGSVLSHLVRGFKSYLSGRTGQAAEAYIELMQLTRDDKLGESDPNNMLYYFFAADILTSEEEDEEINRLTLLSKGLKYLQTTASRIADPKLKQAYLWKNYWHAKLMKEGREQKLV